jgi:ribosome-associated protein
MLALHPSADRQHLRQLARNARAERDREKPLHAYRELFRALRELFEAA